eukprot:3672713-Pyramimonas_sp.AAC.1
MRALSFFLRHATPCGVPQRMRVATLAACTPQYKRETLWAAGGRRRATGDGRRQRTPTTTTTTTATTE